MFGSFFYLLRARGLNVSLSEWLTFVEAMDKGLFDANFTQFYYLSRSILVKSEADFDKFDSVFLEYFKDVAVESDKLPQELLDWLNNPDHEKRGDLGRGDMVLGLSHDEIESMFKKRLEEQKEEHNGGTYWVGTDGASPFGNDGEGKKGIRVGGASRHRMAMAVAGDRKYRDFRDDAVLNNRSFQLAFRRLRQFSNRIDAPRTELNITDTINATCNNFGKLKLVFDKPRKNTVKLMLLIDSGGSMECYSSMCASLFQAVSKSNHFRDLKVYYFHNCITGNLFTTPRINYRDAIKTDWVLNNIDSEYRVIIVGDALMDVMELTSNRYPGGLHQPTGLQRLRMFRERYRHLVWLTPSDNESMRGSFWGESYEVIKREVDMHVLTVENLTKVIKKLLVAR
ncbi:VWA domain-containing protein [Desulfovibrio sp. OttesenSCG-928-O18]|nr:VWA domain-containing protein [Desulfovibrio sp. OttesenSCG-928-O18]